MAAAGAFFVTGSCVIRECDVYKVWKPSIGEAFVCFAEEGNSHDRKAVAQHQTTSPSITLFLNLRQVQIPLSGTVPEIYIAIMQYSGVPPLPKLEVLPNFRVGQKLIFFRACRGKIAASLRTLDFRFFRICTVDQWMLALTMVHLLKGWL